MFQSLVNGTFTQLLCATRVDRMYIWAAATWNATWPTVEFTKNELVGFFEIYEVSRVQKCKNFENQTGISASTGSFKIRRSGGQKPY